MPDQIGMCIQSIGLPPERHADRVVSAMMRTLAQRHAKLLPAIMEAINGSSDGSPKAQRKMEGRIRRAGAFLTYLKPGKRGHYMLVFHDMVGWNPCTDQEIGVDDEIPERPWLVFYLNKVESQGRGTHKITCRSAPIIFVSVHSLSRIAQRFGARTINHLETAAMQIFDAAAKLIGERGEEAIANVPPAGWRVDIQHGAVVVLKKHEKKRALIAATVLRR